MKKTRVAGFPPPSKKRSRRVWVLLARVPVRAPVSPIVRIDNEPTQENAMPRREAGA